MSRHIDPDDIRSQPCKVDFLLTRKGEASTTEDERMHVLGRGHEGEYTRPGNNLLNTLLPQ
jgi:hypothetical protein